MVTTVEKVKEMAQADADSAEELTDGFHLVIDALKLNGIETIYGVPGIPITDLGRLAQRPPAGRQGRAGQPPRLHHLRDGRDADISAFDRLLSAEG